LGCIYDKYGTTDIYIAAAAVALAAPAPVAAPAAPAHICAGTLSRSVGYLFALL
jgi:hypothetical protein